MNIIGHRKVRDDLRRIAARAIGPQSFLFFGPRRVGKRLVAREFAALFSDTPPADSAFLPDLMVLAPEEQEKDDKTRSAKIPIEAVRRAEGFLSRYPQASKRRVLIIEEAESLTLGAENALLKMLEEPNSTSIIILITHRPGILLKTVLSRLVPVPFSLLSPEEMRVAFPDLTDIPNFFFTLGLPGLLMEARNQPERFDQKKEYLKTLFQLSRQTMAKRLALAEVLAKDEGQAIDLLETWLIGLRQQQAAAKQPDADYFIFLEAVLETLDALSKKEGNPRLLLEKLFTSL